MSYKFLVGETYTLRESTGGIIKPIKCIDYDEESNYLTFEYKDIVIEIHLDHVQIYDALELKDRKFYCHPVEYITFLGLTIIAESYDQIKESKNE